MQKKLFLQKLQEKLTSFEDAISTSEKEWIIKGFIDVYKNIYTISLDTKIISKVLELLLFPLMQNFAKENNLILELSPEQNFYPDLTFIDKTDNSLFAVDIKSTYRTDENKVNGMTLGAFTGYFRNRESTKNIGSVTEIKKLLNGEGPFAELGESVFDDYWEFYLTSDMASALETSRPYTNLKEYLEYKNRNSEILSQHKSKIENSEEEK